MNAAGGTFLDVSRERCSNGSGDKRTFLVAPERYHPHRGWYSKRRRAGKVQPRADVPHDFLLPEPGIPGYEQKKALNLPLRADQI